MQQKNSFDTSIVTLKSLGVPRVWSLVVSIFGELAFRPGDQVSGPFLTLLTDAMDIKPEAVRVALHRLRNDGWLSSSKSGRTASHQLTKNAIQQRNDVSRWIYDPLSELPDSWKLVVAQSTETKERANLKAAGFVQILPRIHVAHSDATTPENLLTSSGNSAPDWSVDLMVPQDLTDQFSELFKALKIVNKRLASVPQLHPMQIALLRCLVVHHWRRLVLRHPYLPPALTGLNWPGHLCRVEVLRILEQWPRPKISELTQMDDATLL